MEKGKISIDQLIEIVARGGKVKTGVDIYNKHGVLLLEQDVLVDSISILESIKKSGVSSLPIFPNNSGGLWDENGEKIQFEEESTPIAAGTYSVDNKLKEIRRLKKEASENYIKAKSNIRKVLTDIKETGGEFDYDIVEDTVTDLLGFLSENENGFSYLTKEIFSYDDYLHNHCVNVCTIGTAVLTKFNRSFSESVNSFLAQDTKKDESFLYYQQDELQDISIGYFLHDIGKVLVPDVILNKKGKLTEGEFDIVRRHSYERGMEILEKNGISNPIVKNIVRHHHSVLYTDEKGCYPNEKNPAELPAYVKICKLSDIYDAMTSKRCYKEAFNPINVVTEIFRKYAQKDNLLQYILYAFVKSIGIYPPGSVIMLDSGQYAYILDSTGPIVIPITDSNGKNLDIKHPAMDLSEETGVKVNSDSPLLSPTEAYDLIPEYLKEPVL